MRRPKCSLKLHVKLHQQWRTVVNSECRKSTPNQGIALIPCAPGTNRTYDLRFRFVPGSIL